MGCAKMMKHAYESERVGVLPARAEILGGAASTSAEGRGAACWLGVVAASP
jgi:hypothetical protein